MRLFAPAFTGLLFAATEVQRTSILSFMQAGPCTPAGGNHEAWPNPHRAASASRNAEVKGSAGGGPSSPPISNSITPPSRTVFRFRCFGGPLQVALTSAPPLYRKERGSQENQRIDDCYAIYPPILARAQDAPLSTRPAQGQHSGVRFDNTVSKRVTPFPG
jgi:hypothetical protein